MLLTGFIVHGTGLPYTTSLALSTFIPYPIARRTPSTIASYLYALSHAALELLEETGGA